MWGVAAQVYGLRRTGDGGVGDFSALATLASESAQRGSHAIAISPMHAMFSAEPNKFSPYSPSSRLFLNIAHIDPAAVLGVEAAQRR
jgi:4-alpha-glucanotransferase